MIGSMVTFPARLTVRTTRAVLTTTRDLSQQALGIVDLVAQVLETPPAGARPTGPGRPIRPLGDQPEAPRAPTGGPELD